MRTASGDIPVLETPRLTLRAFRLGDLDGFMAIYADAEHARFVSRVPDRSAAFEKMSALIGHWQLRGFGRFAVVEKATGHFLGHCGASQLDDAREPELNYAFAPHAAGKGFATEAVRHVLGWLYAEKGWTTAISEINPQNQPSRALAQRLGAVPDGVRDAGFAILDIWRYPAPDVFLNNQTSATAN
ncbi:MAG TPA: GNAT family N-acetyltransferase [Rhizobiaceae bacterium]|nr:GNAT family N-acetyltransferase [Rhizobiaceae bacterium]